MKGTAITLGLFAGMYGLFVAFLATGWGVGAVGPLLFVLAIASLVGAGLMSHDMSKAAGTVMAVTAVVWFLFLVQGNDLQTLVMLVGLNAVGAGLALSSSRPAGDGPAS